MRRLLARRVCRRVSIKPPLPESNGLNRIKLDTVIASRGRRDAPSGSEVLQRGNMVRKSARSDQRRMLLIPAASC
jgi:hypothetical protein